MDLLRTDVRIANVNQGLVQDKNILTIQRRMLINLLGLKKNASPITVAGELKLNAVDASLDRSLKMAHQFRTDYKALLVGDDGRPFDPRNRRMVGIPP